MQLERKFYPILFPNQKTNGRWRVKKYNMHTKGELNGKITAYVLSFL